MRLYTDNDNINNIFNNNIPFTISIGANGFSVPVIDNGDNTCRLDRDRLSFQQEVGILGSIAKNNVLDSVRNAMK